MGFKLTNSQQQIVGQQGKMVLKACPGSGKTFVVAHEVLSKLQQWPHKNRGIAVLSFTNTASEELHKQIEKLSGRYSLGYPHFLGTLDSFIAKYIFMPFGYTIMHCNVRPSIIQDNSWKFLNYAKNMWKRECFNNGCEPLNFYYDDKGELTCIAKDISGCKVQGIRPCVQLKDFCYKRGMGTYADIISIAKRVLRESPPVSKLLHTRYPYIIVDEAQDTSLEQMELIEEISKNDDANILLVGDPDQAIYEWRDADPSVFINKYEDASWKSVLLNENFRCSQNICNASSVFSSLPKASISVGETADYPIKPILAKYDVNSPDKLLEYYLALCKSNKIEIHEDSVAVLVRGKTGLLSKDYSQIKNLWQNNVSKLLSEASYEKCFGKLERAHKLVEKLLYSLYVSDDLEDSINETRIMNVMSIDLWRKFLMDFCRKLPDASLSLKEWKKQLDCLFHTLPRRYELEAATPVVKLKSWTKDSKYKDFLDQPLKDFYAKSYIQGYLNATIHAVKGRTFEAVLLIVTSKGKLTSNMINTKPIDSEAVRTTYVAMTRARKILMVGIPNNIKDKTLVRFDKKNWEYIVI